MHVDSIRRFCAQDYTPQQIEAWAGPKRPEDYVRAMQDGEAMWVAHDASRLLGFAALRSDMIRAVYVAADSARQGVGTSLLAAIEGEARAAGINRLRLESTLAALAFYEAQGFARGAATMHRMRGVDVPCVWMSKKLVLPETP